MAKYLVTTSTDIIRYVSYIVEAESNCDDGELTDEWYEESGKTYVEQSEEIID